MQDLQLMQSGAGGRFFGGERRLRPFPNQALKCPRCDSLNTKFCYYNNYNLSQPRHFCKSCRRYWTKGGVLRNVPVGGGCRKTKRSKPKSSSASDQHKEQKKSYSNSSSDSSSLTPTPTTTTTTTNGPASSSPVPAALLNFQSSRLIADQDTLAPNFAPDQNSDSGIFHENSASFTSLMNVGNTYNFSEILPFQLNDQEQKIQEIELQRQQEKMMEEMKMQELTAGIDFNEIQNRNGTGELTALDWQSSQGLFDLPPNTVDQGYWSQNQWAETDQHIYLP